MMFGLKWSNIVKRILNAREVNIFIGRKKVTINGKAHKCKTDPCPVCSEFNNAMDKFSDAMDAFGKTMDGMGDAVDRVCDAAEKEE